jgi:hypothetical protein
MRTAMIHDIQDRVQLATRVPKALLREIKVHCVATGTNLYDFVSQAVAEKLASTKRRRKVAVDPPTAA